MCIRDRVSTLRKTGEELATLRRAGLVRLYLGVESGNDAVLRAVRKGVDAAGMLEAGRDVYKRQLLDNIA